MTAPPLDNGPLFDLMGFSLWLSRLLLDTVPHSVFNATLPLVPPPLVGPSQDLLAFQSSEPIILLNAYFIAITVMITWAAALHVLLMIWVERKVVARLQDRRGPQISGFKTDYYTGGWRPWAGFLQQVADALKMIQKENITPRDADRWMFHLAPALFASTSVVVLVVLPFSETFYIARIPVGLLLIFAAFALTPLAILMAGWAQNNKYTLMGGMRAGALMMSYEIPLVLSFIAMVVLDGTLDPFIFVRDQSGPNMFPPLARLGLPNWYFLSGPGFLAALIFLLAAVAELERIPFDLPEAEAELVEGWLTEYGGMRFGLIFGMKWLRNLIISALIVIVFFGGWSGPVLPQEAWFLIKVYAIYLVLVWVSWSVPRIRIDQVLSIGWRKLIPFTVLNIGFASSWVYSSNTQQYLPVIIFGAAVLLMLLAPGLRARTTSSADLEPSTVKP